MKTSNLFKSFGFIVYVLVLSHVAEANLRCQRLFPDSRTQSVKSEATLEVPKQSDLKEFFSMIEYYGVSKEAWHRELYGLYLDQIGGVTLGKELCDRKMMGDFTAQLFSELGFIEKNGMLLPPSDLAGVYLKMYQRIFETADKHGIPREKMPLPSIPFQHSENKSFIFIRPGIDQLPDPQVWFIPLGKTELNDIQFAQMTEARRLIIEAGMLHHDMGHVADIIERPDYAEIYFHFITQRRQFLSKFDHLPDGSIQKLKAVDQFLNVTGFARFEIKMGEVLNEWLYLPKKENQKKIKTIINVKETKNFTRAQLINKYQAMSLSELEIQARKLIENENVLFSRHGGGARDSSFHRFRARDKNTDATDSARLIGGSSEVLSAPRYNKENIIRGYLSLESPALIGRLKKLMTDEAATNAMLSAALNVGRFSDRFQARQELIIHHLAEIEYRLHSALSLSITPEVIATDMTNLYQPGGIEKYRSSKTFKYFSTYPKSSAQYFLFVGLFKNSSEPKP